MIAATQGRLKSQFTRQALEIYVLQGLSMGITLIGSVIIARSLGPAGKGTLDLYNLLLGLIAEFGVLGIGAGFMYQLANRGAAIAEVHGDALVVACAAALVGLVVSVSAASVVASALGPIRPGFVAVGLALAGFIAYSAVWSSMMTGLNRIVTAYRLQLALAAIGTAAILGLGLAGRVEVPLVIAIGIVTTAIGAAVQFWTVRRLHSERRPMPTARSLRASLGFGSRIFPGAIANWLHFRIDQVLVGQLIGVSGVGIYALSVRWAELVWLVGYGVLNAAVFRLASSADAGRPFALKVFWLVLGLSSSAAVVMAIMSGPLFQLLYGDRFSGAVAPLVLLLPGVVCWDAARVLSNYISLNRGRPLLPTAVAVAGAALNIVLVLLFLPPFGLEGAAIASSISYGTVLLVTALVFWRTR